MDQKDKIISPLSSFTLHTVTMSITPFIPAKPIDNWGGEDVRQFFIMNKQQYISNSLIVCVDNLCVLLITQ